MAPSWVGLLACALVALLSPSARAAPAPEAAPTAPVQINLVGAAYSLKLVELLQEWFASDGQGVRITRQPSVSAEQLLNKAEGPKIHAWVVLRGRNSTRIVFADSQSRRYFVRDVPLDRALDELGREKLVQVLLASFQAFAERRVQDTPLEQVRQALAEPDAVADTQMPDNSSVPSQEAAPSESEPQTLGLRLPAVDPSAPDKPTPSETSTEESSLSWGLSAGYCVNYRGPAGATHGPRLGLEGWLALGAWGAGIFGRGGYEVLHTESSELVDLSVQRSLFRFGALFGLLSEQRPAWVLALSGGWDAVTFQPVRGHQDVDLRSGATASQPVVSVWMAHFALAGPVRMGASLGADIALSKLHYDVLIDNEPRRTLTPWQVSPKAELSLVWH